MLNPDKIQAKTHTNTHTHTKYTWCIFYNLSKNTLTSMKCSLAIAPLAQKDAIQGGDVINHHIIKSTVEAYYCSYCFASSYFPHKVCVCVCLCVCV